AVEGNAFRAGADGEGAEVRSVRGPELRHGVAPEARYPDAGTVEGDLPRTGTDGEGAQVGSVGSPQLGPVVAAAVHHRDAGAVEGDALGLAPVVKKPRNAPSEARSFVTPLPETVTQMLEPSKATPSGLEPGLKVPRLAPSEARSFVRAPGLPL